MAHIPKRATQHGVFLSGSEIAPPALKPGQKELFRQELYAAEAKAVKDSYLFQDQFSRSAYTEAQSVTLPEDYEDPTRPMKPPDETCVGHEGSTSHWVSEYKAGLTQATAEEVVFGRPYIPDDKSNVSSASLGHGNVLSAYQDEFGKYHSDPRDKIDMHLKRPMDAGTTKGTLHIPGYQGFIPGNTFSEEVARVERGDFHRSVDKTNIEQTHHANLIGYSGHQPQAGINYRGGRHPTIKTTYGHDYPNPEKALCQRCPTTLIVSPGSGSPKEPASPKSASP